MGDDLLRKVAHQRDEVLDYWRVETEHSAVILTLHRNRLLCPKPQYRPGVGDVTLDFPGGRIPAHVKTLGEMQQDVVPDILQRELGLDLVEAGDDDDDDNTLIQDARPLCGPDGWVINSSFSNQRLFGFVAVLDDEVELNQITYILNRTI